MAKPYITPLHRQRRLTSVAAPVGALLVLTACGGGSPESGPPADHASASAAEPTSVAYNPADTGSFALGSAVKLALAAPATPPRTAPLPAPRGGGSLEPGNTAYTELTVRAYGSLAANVGPVVELRKDGATVARFEVRAATPTNYKFQVANLVPGSKIDVVFTNDATINGQDRNLFISYLQTAKTLQLPVGAGTQYDRGSGAQAFDGLDVLAGSAAMPWSGALRITWPAATIDGPMPLQASAARLLQQASFGPTTASISRAAQLGPAAWIAEQMALPFTPDFVNHVNGRFAQGLDFRPGGSSYDYTAVTQRFWATAATSPDQLRKRVAWALHQMLMVSQSDSNLFSHSRAYAQYLDTLNKHAFGNYRQLLEEVALSPAVGIYLSHMRNQKEDAALNRQPDENFARELMQLFSVGLQELNIDGTPRLGAEGKPIETYNNNDVMALAKVFTGYSWGFPDNQLTEDIFKWGGPDYRTATDTRIDLNPMKVYPDQHSGAAKTLFAGQRQALNIPAFTPAASSRRLALDALFAHPNLGPFVGRQLIQRLVTSAPSPAYVARVAAVFNNNGAGTRGDMAAVVRAILLDNEARNDAPTDPGFGRLREPVLRLTHWLRAMNARSASGQYMLLYELDGAGQRALFAPSVFGYYRPGYIPPQTAFSARGATAPEFQLVNESTAAAWVNLALALSGSGIGWNGTGVDVSSNYANLAAIAAQGNILGLVQELNLLLFGGAMSTSLRQALIDAVVDVPGTDGNSHLNRARLAVFLALASPEYMVQR